MLRPFKIWTFCYASLPIHTSPPFFRFSVENVEVSFLLWSLRSAFCYLLTFTYSQILTMVSSLKDTSDNSVFYCYLPWQNLLVASQLSSSCPPLFGPDGACATKLSLTSPGVSLIACVPTDVPQKWHPAEVSQENQDEWPENVLHSLSSFPTNIINH